MAGDNKCIRIGIIGAARVAVYALLAPARDEPRANVVAIASRDVDRAKEYAKTNAIPRVHETYDALLSDAEIDLVYVATPPALHAKIALASIAAGKHVLVEKPFAMSSHEAKEVADAGHAGGVFVAEATHSRHHRLFAGVVEIVRGGDLGDITQMTGCFEAPIGRTPEEFRWRQELGGGALMDLGVYPLAWLRGISGEEPRVASASATIESSVDAAIDAEMDFPSGTHGTIRASMIAQRFTATLMVEGTLARLEVANPLAPQMGHAISIFREGVQKTETVSGPTTFAAQLAAVCSSIQDGTPFPLPDRDYVKSMAAIEAIRRSARG